MLKTKQMRDVKNGKLHSDAVNQILSVSPSWLLRWGVTLFFTLMVIIATLATVIKYPDIVKSQLKLASYANPGKYSILRNSHLSKISASKMFVGETFISQQDLPKIKVGEIVLANLQLYPPNKYGMLRGKIAEITDSVAFNGSILVLVSLNQEYLEKRKNITQLKNGMLADAQILTNESSIFARLTDNMSFIFKR